MIEKRKNDFDKKSKDPNYTWGKKKKSPAPSKSPAKIAPLVMMGAQMLAKKAMEKKQEE